MRDLIPENIRGRYFGKRAAIATALGAGLSLLAGISVDYFKASHSEISIYSVVLLIGAGFGMLGVFFQTRIPEPRMVRTRQKRVRTVLAEPFQDKNFRHLLLFLGSWSFAMNLAAPFFTVYMLQRLHLSMTIVLSLAVLSQLMNVLFFQVWGRLADRFSNKSVLIMAGPLFMLSIFFFPLTTMPESYIMTFPFLILIHVLAGMSTAGMILCTGNIALKLAPQGKATAYLATNALVSGIAATIAPILGGIVADWFANKELRLTLTWTTETMQQGMELPAMSFRGLDFLFLGAIMFGMYSLHRLLLVKEVGDAEEGVVLSEFHRIVGRAVRHVSNVSGLRHLFHFPYGKLIELLSEDDLIPGKNGLPASPGLFDPGLVQKELE
jgi:MFS family permease